MNLLLNQQYYAQIDEEDYIKVRTLVWSFDGEYVSSHSPEGKKIYLHRFVMDVTSPSIQVDHRDGDKLNCKKLNLRLATNQQNSYNSSGHKLKLSGLPKGVFKCGKKYSALIKHNGVQIYLGVHSTVEKAQAAYQAKATEIQGEFAAHNTRLLGVDSDPYER